MATHIRSFRFSNETQRSVAMTKARSECQHLRHWAKAGGRDEKFSWRFVDDGKVTAYVVEQTA